MRALLPVLLLLTPCRGQLSHGLTKLQREGVRTPHILFMVPEAPHPAEGGPDASEEVASSEERRPDQVPFAEEGGVARSDQRPSHESAHPLPEHGPPFVQEAPDASIDQDGEVDVRSPPGASAANPRNPDSSPQPHPTQGAPEGTPRQPRIPQPRVPPNGAPDEEALEDVYRVPTDFRGGHGVTPHIISRSPAAVEQGHPYEIQEGVPSFVDVPHEVGVQRTTGEDFVVVRVFHEGAGNEARPEIPERPQTEESSDSKEARLVLPVAEIPESADVVGDLSGDGEDRTQTSGGDPSAASSPSSESLEDSGSGVGGLSVDSRQVPSSTEATAKNRRTLADETRSQTSTAVPTTVAADDKAKVPVIVYMSNAPPTKTPNEEINRPERTTTETTDEKTVGITSRPLNPEAGSPSELEPVVIIWPPTDPSSPPTSSAATTTPVEATSSPSVPSPGSTPASVDPVFLNAADQNGTTFSAPITTSTAASATTTVTQVQAQETTSWPTTTTTTTTTTASSRSVVTTTEPNVAEKGENQPEIDLGPDTTTTAASLSGNTEQKPESLPSVPTDSVNSPTEPAAPATEVAATTDSGTDTTTSSSTPSTSPRATTSMKVLNGTSDAATPTTIPAGSTSEPAERNGSSSTSTTTASPTTTSTEVLPPPSEASEVAERTEPPAPSSVSPSPAYVPTQAPAAEVSFPEVTANEIGNETSKLAETTVTEEARTEAPSPINRSTQSPAPPTGAPPPVATIVSPLGPPRYYELPPEKIKPSVFATQMVRTRNGQIKGSVIKSSDGTRVNSFLGIPYAQPPVGSMRFERPMEFPPWTGVFEAKRLPKSCPQPSMQLNAFIGVNASETSEDCLYLNVWSPFCDGSKKCRSAPVVVYIHGGGFIHGGSDWPIFDGAELAAKAQLVVVTLNYRLGALGFLYVPSNGGRPERANMGLYDQHLALRWVKSNIKAFGGDHNKITIMGQDAGGASVGHHILTPRSSGLFRRAVMQSGSPFSFVLRNTRDRGETLFRSLASYTDCTTVHPNSSLRYDDVLHCMKKLPFERIISASDKFNGRGANSFFPVMGEDFIPMNPKNSLVLKRFTNVDLLVTTTRSEGAFFLQHFLSPFTDVVDPDKINPGEIVFYLRVFLSALLGGKSTASLNELTRNTEPETREEKEEFLRNISAVIGDYPFLCATSEFGAEYAGLRHNVYHMQYDHRPWFLLHPTWFPATHGDDTMFWLGSVYKLRERSRADEHVADELLAILTAFASKGTPQTRAKLTWPRINQGGYYMSVGSEVTELLRSSPSNCRRWSRHYPQY